MLKSKNEVWHNCSYGHQQLADLLSCKFHKLENYYVIEIKVWMEFPCETGFIGVNEEDRKKAFCFPSIKVLESIYNAIGEHLYPEKEELILNL